MERTATRWICTGEEYHSDPGLGQSSLKAFLTDPEHFYAQQVARTAERSGPTASQQFGLDFERLVFFGETPGVLIPDEVLASSTREGKTILSRRGPAWTEWRDRMIEQHGEGVRLMRQDEWDSSVVPLLLGRDKLRAHDRANKLIYGAGQPHLALRWVDELTGIPCKCQLDMLHGPADDPRVIVDLKTAVATNPREFQRAVINFGYHIQAWWYRNAVERWTGRRLPFVFVVVKNKPSFCVETFDLDEDWFELAEVKVRAAMQRLRQAYDEGKWTTSTHGHVVTLKPPRWAYYEVEETI